MTVDEARIAIAEMCEAQLFGAGYVEILGAEKVAAACNGIGPASWPEKRRQKLNRWLAVFRLAADVHDCRFTYSNDGSRTMFHAYNMELLDNCLILADREYNWYNPLRYWARHGAHLVYKACDMFGWDAWQDAAARRA